MKWDLYGRMELQTDEFKDVEGRNRSLYECRKFQVKSTGDELPRERSRDSVICGVRKEDEGDLNRRGNVVDSVNRRIILTKQTKDYLTLEKVPFSIRYEMQDLSRTVLGNEYLLWIIYSQHYLIFLIGFEHRIEGAIISYVIIEVR